MPKGKNPPEIRVLLNLEGHPEVHIVAGSYEDEQRLRIWLERAGLDELPAAIRRALTTDEALA